MSSADALIAAYRRSYDRLVAASSDLTEEQLASQSFDTEWSVGQVLSHLGSGAEIFALILEAGLSGQDAPGIEVMKPIWAVWDAKGPVAMRDDALVADRGFTERLESLTDAQRESFSISLWAGPVGLAEFVQMRLGEHALHTWDVETTFDVDARVPDDAVELLLPAVPTWVGRGGKPQDPAYRVLLSTTDGRGDWVVTTGEPVSIVEADGGDVDGTVRLPSEALLRLVTGRLDEPRTPAVEESGERGLADLRQVFPGF
jgi:uncharacterized protein (TIGR03083 family)